MRVPLQLTVNGADVSVEAEPRRLLSDLLRVELGLTGTHVGCSYGACGACTVIVDGLPARSCLTLAAQVDGADVVTVEGLAGPESLSEVQAAFHQEHGLQCGFCTPGLLCSISAYLQSEPDPSPERLDEVVAGHLCRCTGYVGIRRAARRAAGLSVDLRSREAEA